MKTSVWSEIGDYLRNVEEKSLFSLKDVMKWEQLAATPQFNESVHSEGLIGSCRTSYFPYALLSQRSINVGPSMRAQISGSRLQVMSVPVRVVERCMVYRCALSMLEYTFWVERACSNTVMHRLLFIRQC